MGIKVGVITKHRTSNYGSVLQSYATEKVFERHGYETEIIDYYPRENTIIGQLKALKRKSKIFKNPFINVIGVMAFFPSYLRKKIVFEKYLKRKIVLTKKTYKYAQEICDADPCEDIYCIGGDQTLNKFVSLDVFDNLSDASIKVAYSSSFGKDFFDSVDDFNRAKKSLSRFHALSCREDSGVEIMHQMGREDSRWIIDPAFLLTRDEWDKERSHRYDGKKFILVYNLHHDKKLEHYQKELSKKYGIPVINVCMHWFELYRYGKKLWVPSVEDFLDLFYNAEFVLSDSFHATVFSLLFHKKFMTISPERVGARIISISNLFGLQDRVIQWGKNLDYLTIINNEIDFKQTDQVIEEERVKANEFIESWKAFLNEKY